MDKRSSALKSLKAGKTDRLNSLNFVAEDVYDEVDEKDYQNIVRKRQQEDEFVVDDDGCGYFDDGKEDWQSEKYQNPEEEESSKKDGKKSKLQESKKPTKLSSMFANASKAKKPPTNTHSIASASDSDLLNSLWNNGPKKETPKKPPPKPVLKSSLGSAKKTTSHLSLFLDDTLETRKEKKLESSGTSEKLSHTKVNDNHQSSPRPDSKRVKFENDLAGTDDKVQHFIQGDDDLAAEFANLGDDAFDGLPFVPSSEAGIQLSSVMDTDNDPGQDFLPPLSSECNQPQLNLHLSSTQDIPLSNFSGNFTSDSVMESDGSIRFFWIDAYDKGDGTVFLFGKVLNKENGKYISCSIAIHNIERSIFALPKIEGNMKEFHREFTSIAMKMRIEKFKIGVRRKKYAFELPDVPSESEYYEIVYSYGMPTLPQNLCGETFHRVFGTNTTALEHLIVKAKLMGPCWLSIQNAVASNKNVSWCKVEAECFGLECIRVADFDLPAPPLTVMSINLKTHLNKDHRANEIVCASFITWTGVSMDGTSKEDESNCNVQTVVRQLNNIPFPFKFEQSLQKEGMKVELSKNERGLLNYAMAAIHKVDPDVIVGHNFLGFDLDVLLHRMKANKIEFWSRLGRLKRSVWPKMQSGPGGMGESTFAERSIVSGRLICDTYLSAKDLVKSKSYSLGQLAKDILNLEKGDLDFERIPEYFASAKSLIYLLNHCQNDAFMAASLMSKLMVLPLTKQLTNIAGNLWNRTLTGARAERNEYLLLHEFFENDYICPDKTFGSSKPIIDEDDEHAGEAPKKGGRRKPTYSGGLVLEPKKGLYDKFVLLLDFNSLYPSIIQEFNICFTTVNRRQLAPETGTTDEDDVVPNVPDSSLPQGILPKLLANLVSRRRQVKSLMKDPKLTALEYGQLDIRQKALKLTANSMYGCLGFSHSRFYAKPLAMLITFKGREILQNTVDMTQDQCHLEVVYGDTDSIMINTGSEDLAQAKQIGQVVKKCVNEKYKLLEIELDGVFKKLLLLKKKKYAAVVIEEGKDGITKLNVETKGLDLVRRDWCQLSVETSSFVLDQILSEKNREDVVDAIHLHLTQVGERVKNGLIPIEKFAITKSLTKAVEDYADAKTQPHVQVALRLKNKGFSFRTGDTVQYVICEGNESGSLAERAFGLDEVRKPDSGLKLDFNWYLKQQVHPPIGRLCEHIEGTDLARLADCLGLDASKYHHHYHNSSNYSEQFPVFRSQISDSERFKNVEKLICRCPTCSSDFEFQGLVRELNGKVCDGMLCPKCGVGVPSSIFEYHLIKAYREHSNSYHQHILICDDVSCQKETRKTHHSRCTSSGCRGSLSYKYSETQIYDQLLYLVHLFDGSKILVNYSNHEQEEIVKTLVMENEAKLKSALAFAKEKLSENGRSSVNLFKIFGRLKLGLKVVK